MTTNEWRIKWIFAAVALFNLLGAKAAKIAIIGAGASGLAAAKNALQQNHNVTVFEKTSQLGGIWFYTDKTGKDQFGVEIHTPMYRGLISNGPYQAVEYPDFPYPRGTPSYPSHENIWEYLNAYADEHNLRNHIKFNHLVEKVFWNGNQWNITIRKTNKICAFRGKSETFDAVFVCNGFASSPVIPDIPGLKKFKGKRLHSKSYRYPEKFAGQTVLVVGTGNSGLDIARELSTTGINVTVSQRGLNGDGNVRARLGPNFSGEIKGDIREFTSDGVIFNNTSRDRRRYDTVIFATGYEHKYPFLESTTNIKVFGKNYVSPLYKQILYIENPTMAFIGIPLVAAHFVMYDLQARFALKYISTNEFPSKEVMLKDMEDNEAYRRNENIPNSAAHILKNRMAHYFEDLANTAQIDGIKPVYANILIHAIHNLENDPQGYRMNKYTIISDVDFEVEKIEE